MVGWFCDSFIEKVLNKTAVVQFLRYCTYIYFIEIRMNARNVSENSRPSDRDGRIPKIFCIPHHHVRVINGRLEKLVHNENLSNLYSSIHKLVE
jgi:hypothetical protein